GAFFIFLLIFPTKTLPYDYVAKMTFLGLATFPWKRLKKAKNTVKQRILQQKRSKIHAKFTKMQRNFNTYEKRP
ncbi:MAG: hypothetical protein ACLTIC_13400, partial [Waltera sp.]